MINKKIQLLIPYKKIGIVKHKYGASLVTYVQDNAHVPFKRPAVLICPGGGYERTSPREAECVALRYVAMGYQAFVLYYSCAPDIWPTALMEVATAISTIRSNAKAWHLDPDQIIVTGFSAGGHLAASIGCFWNCEFVYGPLELTKEQIKPNGNILCYPVITAGEYAHRGSFDNLCDGDEELLKLTSLEYHVTKDNPPTFMWHTYTDTAVPVENTLLYLSALRKAGVSAEVHIYPKGPHGLSLCNRETGMEDGGISIDPAIQPWIEMSGTWIEGLKNI